MNNHSKINATLSISFIYLKEKGNTKDKPQKIEFPNSYNELFKIAKKTFKEKFITQALYTESGELIHNLNNINPGSIVLASSQSPDHERSPSPVHTPRKTPTPKSNRKSSNDTFNKFFGITDSNEIGQLDVVSEVDTLSFKQDLSKEFEDEIQHKYVPHEETDQVNPEGEKQNDLQDTDQTTPSTKISAQKSKITPQSSKITPQNSKITPQNSKITPQNSKITPQSTKSSKITPQRSKPVFQHSTLTPQSYLSTKSNLKKSPSTPVTFDKKTTITEPKEEDNIDDNAQPNQNNSPLSQPKSSNSQNPKNNKSNLRGQQTYSSLLMKSNNNNLSSNNNDSNNQTKSNRIKQSGSIPVKLGKNHFANDNYHSSDSKNTDTHNASSLIRHRSPDSGNHVLSLSKSKKQNSNLTDDDNYNSNEFSDDILQNKTKSSDFNDQQQHSNKKRHSHRHHTDEIVSDNENESPESRKRVGKHMRHKSPTNEPKINRNEDNDNNDENEEYHDYDDDAFSRSRKTKKQEPKPIDNDSKKPQPGDVNYVNENEYQLIPSQLIEKLGPNMTKKVETTFSNLNSEDPSISEFLAKAPRLEALQRKDWINSCIRSANEAQFPVLFFRNSDALKADSNDVPMTEDDIYGYKEMTDASRQFFKQTSNGYKRAIVYGPKGSGKTTFLSVLIRETLIDLSAKDEWRNTFIVFFDIKEHFLALKSENLSSLLRVISSETFKALANSRPNFRKYEHEVNQVISNLFESNQQLPKSFLADQDFKLFIPPLTSIINELKDLLNYPDHFNAALLTILYLPLKIADAAHFKHVMIVADDFDSSCVNLSPMSPFSSSLHGMFYQDALCKLLSRCNFLISCKDQLDISSLSIQNHHTLTTYDLIKPEDNTQNQNPEEDKNEKKEFVIEFEGRKEKFVMGKEMCGGVPRYLKLWDDIVGAYNTYKESEADEDVEENLILLISVAQDLVNEIFISEETLNVVNINMK